MIPLNQIGRQLQAFTKSNSPVILTGVGVAGVISTGILSAKAGYKHGVSEARGGISDDPKRRVKEASRFYIAPVTVGTTAIAAILGANSISTKRNAAIAGAYAISTEAFKEYKDKVLETMGEKKAEKIEDDIATDRIRNNPPESSQLFIGKGEVLCRESITGRDFKSDYESIRRAQNDIDTQCINSIYASQNDFYKLLGLPPVPSGDETGWNTSHRLETRLSSVLTETGEPAIYIGYDRAPSHNYYKGHGWN